MVTFFSVKYKKNDNGTLDYLQWKEYNTQRGYLRLFTFSSGEEDQEILQYCKRTLQISLNKDGEST